MPANERLYGKLALGITVTEFMPDGKSTQPTIAVIDWADATANRWDVTEELEVLAAQGTHHRTPDVVAYVNGIPLVVIEPSGPSRAAVATPAKAMVTEGISQHLRNQRPDEIPNLFAYAQLLLSISQTEGRYGTTHMAAKFWAKWREESSTRPTCRRSEQGTQAGCARGVVRGQTGRAGGVLRHAVERPDATTEQDRLLVSLLTPARLLEFLRGYVLFDRKVGKIRPATSSSSASVRCWRYQPEEARNRKAVVARVAWCGTPRGRTRVSPWCSDQGAAVGGCIEGMPCGGGDRPH